MNSGDEGSDDCFDDDEARARIRVLNAERLGAVNSATMEPPATLCEECGLEECDCDQAGLF